MYNSKSYLRKRGFFASLIGLTLSGIDRESRSIWEYEREEFWFIRMLNNKFHEHWKKWLPNDSQYFCRNCYNYSTCYGKERYTTSPCNNKREGVAIALWQLSTRNSFRTTAKTFTIAKPAAVQITPDVCSEIKRLANGFIKFPSTRRATAKAIKKFRILCRCQIPQALGAFDCTHIWIKTLSVQRKVDCHSRKHCRTISAQATVGANLVFLDVTTGFPGSWVAGKHCYATRPQVRRQRCSE